MQRDPWVVTVAVANGVLESGEMELEEVDRSYLQERLRTRETFIDVFLVGSVRNKRAPPIRGRKTAVGLCGAGSWKSCPWRAPI